VRAASPALSIILSINSGGLGPTAGYTVDKRPDHGSLDGERATRKTDSGPLAVSPIRPLSHLSNGHTDTSWTLSAAPEA
jgi:hypothetical protein